MTSQLSTNPKYRVVFFSHGGGPMPLLNDPGHQAMIRFMRALPGQLIAPKAIIVFSAHWEEPAVTLQTHPTPPMFYDYYGFPPETYQIQYPAPGAPELAQKIEEVLNNQNIPTSKNPSRGYDHGHFIPLSLMYPEANIPTFQISLIKGLDPTAHLQLGEALRPFLERDVLFIGSGFSYHNLRAFSWKPDNTPDPLNTAFQDWLIDTCTATEDHATVSAKLQSWSQAPGARYAHPREEHLIPLMICAGLAAGKADLVFDDYILGKRATAFAW
ncbi:MAG: class III extradiol ring-cleavage dioxygenase [Anaerolineaceae bacterium]